MVEEPGCSGKYVRLAMVITTVRADKEIITEEIIDKMATTIKFTKMQGAGNDYIYVNTLKHLMS